MLNVLSLFSGIGAFEKALDNLGIPYNLVGYCEIDKYASKAYSIIHNVPEELNLRDVTKVDILDVEESVDLITYGFPCQDISNAGQQKGFTDENGNRTRSGLFFEALRIIEDYKPKFAIAENVKALTSKRFTEEFKTVLESLDEAGYNNYWQVLNAKDYGIPQNRERVFIISIRKDIDKGFKFPMPFPLELKLKDLLEDEVDEKYYLSEQGTSGLIRALDRPHKPNILNEKECCGTIDTKIGDNTQRGQYLIDKSTDTYNEDTKKVITLGRINSSQDGVVVSPEGISPTHTAGHGNTPKVLVREATKRGYTEAYPGDTINLNYPNSKTRRGRVGKDGVANALTCTDIQAVVTTEEKDEIDAFLDED